MSSCRVCNRPLRSPHSQMIGVGPKCATKVRAEFQQLVQSVRSGNSHLLPQYANQLQVNSLDGINNPAEDVLRRYSYIMATNEVTGLLEQQARQTYLANMRLRRRPSATPVTVGVESRTSRTSEPVTVSWIDSRTALVTSSGSGQTYTTTHNGCTCPDYLYRHRGHGGQCRHMQAMDAALNEIRDRRRAARRGAEAEIPVQELPTATTVVFERPSTPPQELPEDFVERQSEYMLRDFAQIDFTIEEQRQEVLEAYRHNRGFDGTFVSQDDEAWSRISQQAEGEWEYKYDRVLGGTNNTFGVELEVKFPSAESKQRALQQIYEAGLIPTPQEQGYHSNGPSGFWKSERDGSLYGHSVEFVSPVLHDNAESWQSLEKISEIIRSNGGFVDQQCGTHVHIGIGPLDHHTYSYQRLGRIGVGFEHQFYRMGGANSDSYRLSGDPGRHRSYSATSDYAAPLPDELSISGNASAESARRSLSPNRYRMFNFTNIDSGSRNRRPALEMRYPNGTIDHRQIQAQVQVANAVVHQAAIITNEHPVSDLTPRYSERNKQMRRRFGADPAQEEANFRKFLDVLGNNEDRHAATWLWKRGRV